MSFKDKLPMIAVIVVLVGGAGVVVSNIVGGSSRGLPIDVKVPVLSATAQKGEAVYSKNCAACHGKNAGGSDQGPPLVYDTYNPGHHADGAFYLAVISGVRQHHWKFGNMPAQPNVSKAETRSIVTYVRELQRANGIFYKPHKM